MTFPGCWGCGPGARTFCAKSIGRAGPLPGGFDRLPQDTAGRAGVTQFGIRNVEFGILCFSFHSAFRNRHSAFWLPARSMKWKPPHDFCPEGPCPRACHPPEGHLSVWRPFQFALSGSMFFIPPALPEVMIPHPSCPHPSLYFPGFPVILSMIWRRFFSIFF